MTLFLALVLSAQAQDCPTELTVTAIALEAAAVELELAAGSLETMEAEVIAMDHEVADSDEELDHAEDLLELLFQASLAAPEQPMGAYAPALRCYFDEASCPEGDAQLVPIVAPEPTKGTKKRPGKKP